MKQATLVLAIGLAVVSFVVLAGSLAQYSAVDTRTGVEGKRLALALAEFREVGRNAAIFREICGDEQSPCTVDRQLIEGFVHGLLVGYGGSGILLFDIECLRAGSDLDKLCADPVVLVWFSADGVQYYGYRPAEPLIRLDPDCVADLTSGSYAVYVL